MGGGGAAEPAPAVAVVVSARRSARSAIAATRSASARSASVSAKSSLSIFVAREMLAQLDEEKEVEVSFVPHLQNTLPQDLTLTTLSQVRWIDQQMICEFGRLNARKKELREEAAELERRAGDLADAEEGAMLAEEGDGATKLLVGEAFVDVDAGAALASVQAGVAADRAALAAAAAAVEAVEARQAVLKRELYARFGRNINLEE